jgi:hypothetical protein
MRQQAKISVPDKTTNRPSKKCAYRSEAGSTFLSCAFILPRMTRTGCWVCNRNSWAQEPVANDEVENAEIHPRPSCCLLSDRK